MGALTLGAAASADAAALRAGAGKADITPRTGYYLGGWTRADRVAQGQHTRLWARALVLEQGGRKVALVAVDLFMVPGGLVKHVGDALASRGLSEQTILMSASHTHSGPGGYANFETFNTAAPSPATVSDPFSFYRLLDPKPADPQLYSFLVRRIATAIRRADADLGPAAAGWGSAELHGLTMNRSIEAHLANHGMSLERGQGSAQQDPAGVAHTIDPSVNVLRVDKIVRGRRVPIGGWSTFADHGTVTKSSFPYYNQDHHGSALQVFERRVRRAGRVPRRQEVLNVYGNSNEGDQSAGLVRDGPAASDYVGRVEAAAMLRAWRAARPIRGPVLDSRWTRVCFCGQPTEGGNVADYAMIGIPFLTGSEEERGPLFDLTRVPFEGTRNPLPVPGQGHKLGIPLSADSVPKAVPLMAVRVGDGVIVTLPGEPTAEVGARLRAAISGVGRVVVSGVANEFIQYLTTPEEYERQHYEGGSTLYGPFSSNLLGGELAELTRRLMSGEPAQAAYPFDPTNGVSPQGEPFGPGAASATVGGQPRRRYRRLERVSFTWQGGAYGVDRPLDRPFVRIERLTSSGRRTVDSDLGLGTLWKVDDKGRYEALWEVPLHVRAGRYRMLVTAKRYRLASRAFRIAPARSLTVRRVEGGVTIDYPAAVRDQDLRHRPASASGGVVRYREGNRTVTLRRRRGTVFPVPGGATLVSARDRYGNRALTSSAP
ncbi:MAG TPA: neutral/alkaline non-lysosomal ceramidase N-terminal domain-containing protein [Thermoleophilaceae bacterium]|nr:neutral/alkaline non-lysosomal ceramidase N-terminal domain-containing protein [Thermoleophilaceae bacterium]